MCDRRVVGRVRSVSMSSPVASDLSPPHDSPLTTHHSPLAHHFEDLEQQKDAATLGMWAFLATEVLFFGGVLMCYAVYRGQYTAEFNAAAGFQNVILGTVNTLVLICSSLTMALAVHAAESGHRAAL